MSVATLARRGFSKIFEDSREQVTVRVVTWSRNSEDDQTKTTASYSTYAKIERGGVDGRQVLGLAAGTLGDADLAMYFPYTYTTGLAPDNYITYDSVNYKITQVKPYRVKDSTLVYTKVYLKQTNETF